MKINNAVSGVTICLVTAKHISVVKVTGKDITNLAHLRKPQSNKYDETKIIY